MRAARRDGIALVGALALTTTMMPLVAQLSLGVQLESLLTGRAGVQAQAFYAAEAGIALALDALARGVVGMDLEAGPDRVTGTSDDGRFPFTSVPTFPSTRYAIDVGVRRLAPERIELTSEATGPHEIVRAVQVIVELPAAGGPPRVLGWREIR